MADTNFVVGILLLITGFALIGLDALQLGLDIPMDTLTVVVFVSAIIAMGVPIL